MGCCDFDAGRGLLEGRPDGLMRLYACRSTGAIAGGEMVGPAVEHLAQFAAVLVQQEMTPADALRLPFYHPTFEEGLKDCLRDLARQLHG